MDVKAFCEAESIGKAIFYQWRWRLRETPATKRVEMRREGFIEVGQLGPAVAEQTGVTIPPSSILVRASTATFSRRLEQHRTMTQ